MIENKPRGAPSAEGKHFSVLEKGERAEGWKGDKDSQSSKPRRGESLHFQTRLSMMSVPLPEHQRNSVASAVQYHAIQEAIIGQSKSYTTW